MFRPAARRSHPARHQAVSWQREAGYQRLSLGLALKRGAGSRRKPPTAVLWRATNSRLSRLSRYSRYSRLSRLIYKFRIFRHARQPSCGGRPYARRRCAKEWNAGNASAQARCYPYLAGDGNAGDGNAGDAATQASRNAGDAATQAYLIAVLTRAGAVLPVSRPVAAEHWVKFPHPAAQRRPCSLSRPMPLTGR